MGGHDVFCDYDSGVVGNSDSRSVLGFAVGYRFTQGRKARQVTVTLFVPVLCSHSVLRPLSTLFLGLRTSKVGLCLSCARPDGPVARLFMIDPIAVSVFL